MRGRQVNYLLQKNYKILTPVTFIPIQIMDNLSAFIHFLLEKKYTLVEDNKQLKIVTYQLNGLFVQIVQERNFDHFISISRTNNHNWEGWYSMDTVRFLILQEHYQLDRNYKFEQLSRFFMDYYNEIIKAFSLVNFPASENILDTLQKERAKALFGY